MSCADDELDVTEALAVTGQATHEAPQRREPDAAADHQHVTALGAPRGPDVAERSAHDDLITRVQRQQPGRDRADTTDGVGVEPEIVGVGADRDGRLAETRQPDHPALRRLERGRNTAHGGHVQRPYVVELVDHVDHPMRHGDEERVGGHRWPDPSSLDTAAFAANAADSMVSAAASTVRSMPTGHHVMHRPHPTQPLSPYWSHHVPSLCVNH